MKNLPSLILTLSLFLSVSQEIMAEAPAASDSPEAKAKVTEAQTAWCEGLVNIAQTQKSGGDSKAAAIQMLDNLYDFEGAGVVFKPTLTYGESTFRTDKKGALAYFVGGDSDYPSDSGFALSPWKAARFQLEGIVVQGDVIVAVGNIWLTDEAGDVTMVDKTFAYRVGADGKLRIIAHHSSLPFKVKKAS